MKKMTTLGLAAALSLASALSVSAACGHDSAKQVMSCAEGTQYDSETGTCKVVSG